MPRKFGSILKVATLGVAGLLAAGSALADGRDLETRSVVVRAGDLDLASPAGAAELYARIRSAARDVCGRVDGRDLEVRRAWLRCYRPAVAGAVAQAGSEAVTALHAAREGRRGSRAAPLVATR